MTFKELEKNWGRKWYTSSRTHGTGGSFCGYSVLHRPVSELEMISSLFWGTFNFSKQWDPIVSESIRMTFPVCFSALSNLNAAFLERNYCNVDSFICSIPVISFLSNNSQLRTHHCIHKVQIFSSYYFTLHNINFISHVIMQSVWIFLSFYNYSQLVLFFTVLS